ncbi:MAG: cation transporter [Gammaproteobacteria bacterium]|nr:MAG: cation transporter [Gammaproteobacteria bacterium]
MDTSFVSKSCCQNQIDVAALHAKQRRVLIIILVLNSATFLMMVFGSIISGSSSLLSGALDNFGDALTYALSLMVISASLVAKARVALFKGVLILGAALVVAIQIAWSLFHPATPAFESMGIAAFLNLGVNLICLWLLMSYRYGDVNMSSAWECSRNDVNEGIAVIAAALGVWVFQSGWPDLVIAVVLLILFLRSAIRVLRSGWRELHSSL